MATTPPDPFATAGTALLRHPLVMMVVGAGASLLVTYGASRTELATFDRRATQSEARLDAQDKRDQAHEAELSALKVRLATVETGQMGLQRVLDTELAGVRRELEQLRHLLEKLTDQRPMPASYR